MGECQTHTHTQSANEWKYVNNQKWWSAHQLKHNNAYTFKKCNKRSLRCFLSLSLFFVCFDFSIYFSLFCLQSLSICLPFCVFLSKLPFIPQNFHWVYHQQVQFSTPTCKQRERERDEEKIVVEILLFHRMNITTLNSSFC